MKALHIFERIFHYVRVWLFILAVLFIALGMFSASSLLIFDGEAMDYSVIEELTGLSGADAVAYAVFTVVGGMGAFSFFLVVGSLVAWAFEHIFKKIQVIRSKDACKCCKEEEGDAQVEKIMKWKDFYNEGIITEREFIQKRNEILGLHK